jgi:hypothetical protein
MKRIAWDIEEAGHFEVDLVHHSGGSSAGEYGHTLQLIDVATGWSERVMLLGRSYQAMRAAFEQVSQRLPFAPSKNCILIMARSSSTGIWCASGRRR